MTSRWMVLAVSLWLAACAGDDDQGVPAEPPLFTTGTDAELDTLVDSAVAYLEANLDPAVYGAPADYVVHRAFVDPVGIGHVHFGQTVDGVPVFGGEIIVHFFGDGALRGLTHELVADLQVDPTPVITAEQAIAAADPPVPPEPDPEADLVLDTAPRADLWVVRHEGADHLAWSVQLVDLAAEEPSMPRVFVDAFSGEEVFRYDNLQTLEVDADTLYDGTQPVEAFEELGYGGLYFAEDAIREYHTLTFNNTASSLSYVTTPAGTSFSDGPNASLHFATRQVEDYYTDAHGRDGIDGSGGPGFAGPWQSVGTPWLTGAAHFSTNYQNALWDPVNMLFIAGDGFGASWDPLVSLDIVAHEFTHGVTQFTANLTYSNEPGALNESFSDVFGAAVEASYDGVLSQDVWWIGEDAYTPFSGGDALRYMDDPTADGISRDHYDDRYTGGLDNGGVHWNSGIGNLAFYLTSEGGSHPTYGGAPVAGIGLDAAAAIWYQALTAYLTSSSDLHDARVATLNAATDLYGAGSPEVTAVDEAWALVGVSQWVLLPEGYGALGVGAPSAVYRKPSGDLVMAFEVQLSAPTADCPSGEWGIGLATSVDGLSFAYVDTAPILEPVAGTYRSCVVAHPTIMLDDVGQGIDIWFKTEQDLTACGGVLKCLYTGIGHAHIASDLLTVDTVSATPVITTNGATGFPSVVRSDGTYHMLLQQHPDVFHASATDPEGPWTLDPAPVITTTDTSYTTDEVFNPALVCEGDTIIPANAFTVRFGGRDRDGPWGAVLDGGIGTGTSTNATSWSLSAYPTTLWDNDTGWRHWSALRHGTEHVMYVSEEVGGLKRIGLRSTVSPWTLDGLSSRTCPKPAFW